MKTFEQIVDEVFKQEDKYRCLLRLTENMGYTGNLTPKEILSWKEEYSKKLAQPYYGADIQEPVVAICKKVLEKPECFERVFYAPSYNHYSVLDKTTKTVFRFDRRELWDVSEYETPLTQPLCFTEDEKQLITSAFEEWNLWFEKSEQERSEVEKRQYRQKLINLYCE